ncbi:MAG TPA: SPOR domain-containing protein [Pseudomonadales bacterium]
MIRRSLAYGISLVALLLAVLGRADDDYWVSVGSYRAFDQAQAAREQARARLPESFSVSEAMLDSGIWFRVLAGPYLTREIAEHMVEEARRQGFVSPWILAGSSSIRTDLADYGGDLLSSEPRSADEIDLDDFALDVPDADRSGVPGFAAPMRSEPEKEHILVDEAPAGYRLNRLRRDP